MKSRGRVAVLLSGRGSNFEAIYHNSLKKDANFEIVVVISDKKHARGLAKAGEYGLPAFHISPKKHTAKAAYEREIIKVLKNYDVELVCLAGYMRIVGEELLKEYKNRVINIHPALLPSFPGLHAQQQAVDYGVKVSGCTVHFVDAGVDTGPVIAQQPVAVEPGEDEKSLSRRILKEEHRIYSEVIRLYFTNRLKINERNVIILA
jgi:phosphoribosylglycinamide formyltransferase-1